MNINLKEYKDFVNNLNKIQIDNLGDDYTACWLFAYYFHNKFDLPILNYSCFYEQKQNIIDMNLDKNGIYSYFMSSDTEFHHFVLVVNNDDVILNSTYGGQTEFINIKYKKIEFIKRLQDLILISNSNSNNKKIKEYCNLFGFNKVYFKVLDLTNCEFEYTFKPLNI